MNKYFTGISIMTTCIFISNVNAQDYGAQIDALQNEVLKMKQKINQSSKEDKAYFVKGKGLSIKSTDGKYSFQIKGRLMYDMAAIVHDEKTVNGVTSDYNSSPLGDSEGWGSEFRRLRFTIKGEVGNGWGFALQPDFADSPDMGADRSVVFKDAHIYKKIKGFGKIFVGNNKVAGGMYENTSSNAIVFNERPMHNEIMNFGNRTGITYDTDGVFGNVFHGRMSFFSGTESAFEQNINLGDAKTGSHQAWGYSFAGQYTFIDQNDIKAMVGVHYGHQNLKSMDNNDYDTASAYINGIHTISDKALDLGDWDGVPALEGFTFYGPQALVIYKNLMLQGEYQRGYYELEQLTGETQEEDYDIHGWSIGGLWTVTGEQMKYSGKKGKIGGLKCKRHCTQVKLQYQYADAVDRPSKNTSAANNGGPFRDDGGQGSVWKGGINHFFNSNVKLSLECSHGNYEYDDGIAEDTTNGYGENGQSEVSAIEARLHLKF